MDSQIEDENDDGYIDAQAGYKIDSNGNKSDYYGISTWNFGKGTPTRLAARL